MELARSCVYFVLYYCCRLDRVSISQPASLGYYPKAWLAMNIFLCSSRFTNRPSPPPAISYPLHHFTIIYIPSPILFSHSFFLYFPRVQSARSVLFRASTVLDLKNRPNCCVNSIALLSYFLFSSFLFNATLLNC